ncbi:MAG TPA: PQQ-dependent sugar dehydrogenase [Solirubrobacterales bacterium]|nr:PQQ-dependent sugar dehydrogenase [Solirubrobacterales bacterium]
MRPTRRRLALLGILGCLLLAVPASATLASVLPTGFRDTTLGDGLEEPTAIRFSPDGRIFVALKAGEILVYDDLAALEAGDDTVFADLRTFVNDPGDRGLLGLALDPGFPAEPYVYALYTYDHILGGQGEDAKVPRWGNPDQAGDPCPRPGDADVDACPVSGRLVRLTAIGDHAAEDEGGAIHQNALLEDWCQQFSSHSIGDLQFDADGALYASGGDGASFYGVDYGQFGWPQTNQCGDPNAPAGSAPTLPGAAGGALRSLDLRGGGDPTGLDGSIVRIDPETGEGLPGNPLFASADPNARRIVAYGFRNPFRFVIDQGSGAVYVGNVGWDTWEEVDRFKPSSSGAFDSGWPCYEGPAPNPGYQALGLSLCQGLYAGGTASAPPFFYYRHGDHVIPDDGCDAEAGSAVSGMALYDDGSFPAAYDGALFFADSVRGCIYVMPPGEDGRPDPLATTTFMSEGGEYPGIDLEVGPGGDLYYVKIFSQNAGGTIHRISYDPGAPVARLAADPRWGDAPLKVALDASASSDPNGDALAYEWDLDGNGSFETKAGATVEHTYNGSANVTVSVRVEDGKGKWSVARVTLYPDDSPPQPSIEEPGEDVTWRVGQEIDFSGAATDGGGDPLGDSSLYWKARLYHCPSACHAHPLQVFPGTGEGSFDAPDHDYPSHIEISLTATDDRGLSATRSVSIYPRAVDLTIASDPPGLSLSAGLLSEAAPFGLRAIEGSHVVLAAPATAVLGGREYGWADWSDGGTRVHTVVAEESAAYTAGYALLGAVPPSPALAGRNLLRPRPGLRAHPPKRTRSRTAIFSFASGQSGAGFRCRLDVRVSTSCDSPQTYRRLLPGPHLFRVVAVGDADWADSAATVFRWRVLCRARAGGAATRSRAACARPAAAAGRAGR